MKIVLTVVGKTVFNYLDAGIAEYKKRLKRYIKFDIEVVPEIKKSKSLSQVEQKKAETEKVLSTIKTGDCVVLLDEKGKQFNSEEFAEFINKRMISGLKRLVFVIGGAYGVDKKLFDRADFVISLSSMTFSHQMVRLFFAEQCYRAFTILKNEPYHHF